MIRKYYLNHWSYIKKSRIAMHGDFADFVTNILSTETLWGRGDYKKKAKVNRYIELYNSFPRISYVDKTSKTRLRWIKATMRLIVNGKATECYPMNINDVHQPLYTYIY